MFIFAWYVLIKIALCVPLWQPNFGKFLQTPGDLLRHFQLGLQNGTKDPRTDVRRNFSKFVCPFGCICCSNFRVFGFWSHFFEIIVSFFPWLWKKILQAKKVKKNELKTLNPTTHSKNAYVLCYIPQQLLKLFRFLWQNCVHLHPDDRQVEQGAHVQGSHRQRWSAVLASQGPGSTGKNAWVL